MKCSVRKRCINRGSRLVELAKMFTTAMLSHLNRIWELCQYEPHIAAARSIGSNSFVWIGTWSHNPCQGRCSHLCASSQYASQPQLPEASVVIVKAGGCIGVTTCIMDLPFKNSKKVCHHARSDLKSAVRCIQWSSCLALLAVSIIQRRKIQPGTTILAACDSFSIKERSSRFSLHVWKSCKSPNLAAIHWDFPSSMKRSRGPLQCLSFWEYSWTPWQWRCVSWTENWQNCVNS